MHSWLGNWTMENRERSSEEKREIKHDYMISNCLSNLLSPLMFSVTLLELQMLVAARTPRTARKVLMLMTRLDYTLCVVTTGLILCSPSSPAWSPEPGIIPTPTLPWLLYRSVQRGGKISRLEKICQIKYFFQNLWKIKN